jgi:uncharacterized protein (DUF2062 family)
MIHLTRSIVRRWLERLLHVHDTPKRTAAAFTLGVFVGFSPFLGLHTVIAITLCFIFNLNRVAALLGVYSNVPWIIAGYYAFTTMLGAEVTDVELPPDFRERLVGLLNLSLWGGDFWQQLEHLLEPLLVPYLVGSFIGCTLIAAGAYPAALAFVTRRRGEQHLSDPPSHDVSSR